MDKSEARWQGAGGEMMGKSARSIEDSATSHQMATRQRPGLKNLKSIPLNQEYLQSSGSPGKHHQASPGKAIGFGLQTPNTNHKDQLHYFRNNAGHLQPPKYFGLDRGSQQSSNRKPFSKVRLPEHSLSGFNTTDGMSSRMFRTQSDLNNLSTKHLSSFDPYSSSFVPLSAREEAFGKHRQEVIKTEIDKIEQGEVGDLAQLFSDADRMIHIARTIRNQNSVVSVAPTISKSGAPELDTNTKIKQLYFEYEGSKDVMDCILLSPVSLVTLIELSGYGGSVSITKFLIPAGWCVPGKIDMLGKTLPGVIEFEGKSGILPGSFEVLIGLNYFPHHSRFDLRGSGSSILLSSKLQSEIKSNFSIKFAIFAKETVSLSAYVRLSIKKSKKLQLQMEMNGEDSPKKPLAVVYQEFLDINLRKTVKKKPNLLSKGSVESIYSGNPTSSGLVSMVDKNITDMSLRSPINLSKKIRESCKNLEFKISHAKSIKEQYLAERKEKHLASLQKHELNKQKAEAEINLILEQTLQVARARAWIILLKMFKVLSLTSKKVDSEKHTAQDKVRKNRHSIMIQQKLKPILGWLVKDKSQQNMLKVGQCLRFQALFSLDHHRQQAREMLGVAFKELSKKISLRNLMFNKTSYFIKIKNNWKNFIKSKKRMRVKFSKSIEYVYGRISKIEEVQASNLLREVRYFNTKCRDQLFDLFYNDGLKSYLTTRLHHMAKSAMVRNLDEYFNEASEDHRPGLEHHKSGEAFKDIRERNTLKLHLKGLALAIYKSYLIAADPSLADSKFKRFEKKLGEQLAELNLVPMSLVRIRAFPTMTAFNQTHSRSELYNLILKNHQAGLFRNHIDTVGGLDYDWIKSSSPSKKAKTKVLSLNLAEVEEERQQELILKQHAEKSPGFRRIMNLLAREFKEKFELEVPDEMYVTIVMTSLGYFADKMKQQRLELELSSPMLSPSKSVLY